MTATNHALTGAAIGLLTGNPWLALPAAFLSHFALDALPHHAPLKSELLAYMRSRRYRILLVGEFLACVTVVLLLAIYRPDHWFLAAVCAFLAASPDLFWIKMYIVALKRDRLLPMKNWFWFIHDRIQWCARPWGIWVELAWFVAFGTIFLRQL